ncbi:MAG: hypothetical protein ACLQPH_05310 [Acidimicrobiales bacterium]
MERYRLDNDPAWQRAVAPGAGGLVAAGIDYLVGIERLTGQVLGARMIREFTELTSDR